MELRPFASAALARVAPWFEDGETRRFLGGREWAQELLSLVRRPPAGVTDRIVWLAAEDTEAVGLVDVEVYGDGTASLAIVVDPGQRSRGHGRRILAAVALVLRSRGLSELRGGVHVANEASRRCVEHAGFHPVDAGPDQDGFVDYVLRLG